MKNIITAAMKDERFALEVKATYTYRVFQNGNEEITVSVQKTRAFKACSMEEENTCTMAVNVFDRLSLDDLNWIVQFLRNGIKNDTEITGSIDENGTLKAVDHFGSFTGYLEKNFKLAEIEHEPEEEHENMKSEEKNAVLEKLNDFLAFVKNNELMSTERKIDQGYGFSQGLIAVYDELFDDIAEITQNWICSFYNTSKETKEETVAEQEQEETKTETESLTESEREEIAARMNEEFETYGVKDGYIVLPDQVTESARYRVDSFQNGKHTKEVFQNPTVARWVAEDRKKAGFHVFLLKEVTNSLYDVIEEF